jgi:hypothetical protein
MRRQTASPLIHKKTRLRGGGPINTQFLDQAS